MLVLSPARRVIETVWLTVHVPVPLDPLKIAASDDPGTEAPLDPPELVDQWDVWSQLPVPPTQYLSADWTAVAYNNNDSTATGASRAAARGFGMKMRRFIRIF